ncbi:MAG: hypothetical protein HZB16_20585 [Armatimonadetes bacterium]|nr:hypothetical protein [Armatimonadota bacterium]
MPLPLALPLLLMMAASAPDEPVVRYDATPLTQLDLGQPDQRRRLWDELHLLSGLQGLVNRDSARLYVRFIARWDDYWLAKMRAPGEWLAARPMVEETSLDALLTRYAATYRGVVVYDPDLAASSNLASTVAGCEDLLPIRFDASAGSLYARLVGSGRLKVVRDLRGVAHTKTEAYRWAREQYLDTGRCDPTVMAYYIDQAWLTARRDVGHQNCTLTNHDYFIAHRALFFDLLPWDDETPVDDRAQAVGSDYRTLNELLRSAYGRNGGKMVHVGGFVPWAFKYTNFAEAGGKHEPVATEWRYAEILSAYNAYMDADALGPCGLVNGSFHQHFPLRERYPQTARPTEAELKARGLLDANGLVTQGSYIMFYVGDYDAAAWLYQMFPERWDDPTRGSVPLGWALNPNLQARMAPALHYARISATPNDWFITGDSGAGYLNPGALEPPRPHSGLPSGLAAWVAHNQPYARRWDLGIVGFVIDGFARGMSDAGLDAYAQFAPEGIVAQKIGSVGVHGDMPYVRMRSDLGGSPQEAAGQQASTLKAEGWDFITYRTILHHPGWHREFIDALGKARPESNVRVVDPYTFMLLAKRYAQRQGEHRLPAWPAPSVTWQADRTNGGLTLRGAADGPWELVDREGSRVARQKLDAGQIKYVYYAVNDRYERRPGQPLTLTIEYLDLTGRFAIEYDSETGPYTFAEGVTLGGSGQWRTLKVTLPNPKLDHRQNSGSDLRLINFGGELVVRRLEVGR